MNYNEASDYADRYNPHHTRTRAVIEPPDPSANSHALLIVNLSYLVTPKDHLILKCFRSTAGAHEFIVTRPGKHS